MYEFKQELRDLIIAKYKSAYLCKVVGISPCHFSLILNGKKTCPKRTAYVIAKYFDSDAEIEDYFNIKEK